MFSYKREVKWNRNVVMVDTRIFVFIISIITVFVLFIVFLDGYIAVIIAIPLYCVTIINYINNKIIYNEAGIVINNSLAKKYFISWDNIISIEDKYEDARLSRGIPGRILKICYSIPNNGGIECKKYSFFTYIGILRFLCFYENRLDYRGESRK